MTSSMMVVEETSEVSSSLQSLSSELDASDSEQAWTTEVLVAAELSSSTPPRTHRDSSGWWRRKAKWMGAEGEAAKGKGGSVVGM